jgi:cellulose synthase/poly-beta-1,6-N-acetylglucosamine synthase-like glycosyltransferase
VEKTSFHIPFSFAQRMDYAPWGPCSNISFRKAVLLKVGKFRTDHLFDFSGEDVDIGLRINKLGYKIKCNPRAIVYHNKETWSHPIALCRKIFRWGRTSFHILTQHSYLSANDFPKFTTISLFIAFLATLYGAVTMQWKLMWGLVMWLLCVPVIDAFLRSLCSKGKVSDFVFNYCSFWLIFLYELGSVYESIKNRSLLMLYKRHFYGPGQLLFEWQNRLVQNWSFIISMIILFLLLAFA